MIKLQETVLTTTCEIKHILLNYNFSTCALQTFLKGWTFTVMLTTLQHNGNQKLVSCPFTDELLQNKNPLDPTVSLAKKKLVFLLFATNSSCLSMVWEGRATLRELRVDQ